MTKKYIGIGLATCFYASLLFVVIGLIFLIFSGAANNVSIDHIGFKIVVHEFLRGNSNASFIVSACCVCLSPFVSAIIIIINGIKYKNFITLLYSVILVVLLVVSILFE